MQTGMQDIEYAIRGIDYPKNKNEIINIAKDNNAGDQVLKDLQSLPDKTYNNVADLFEALTGKKEGGLIQDERANYREERRNK